MRFGIIGFQHLHIGLVLEGLKENPDLELVGIAEADPALRAHWAGELGVPAYSSWEELVEAQRVEAVTVVSAYAERAPISIGCLERGIHVLCDKPVAITMEQVDALEAACASSTAHFSALLEKRFWGPYRALKELVEAGALGEIVSAVATGPHKLNPQGRPAWMFDRETYGGTIVDLVIHDIDALLWLCGGNPTTVRAFTGRRRWTTAGDLEDTAQVLFRTDRGLTAFVDVNWLTPTAAPWHGDYRLMLNGTLGAATVRYEGRELIVATDTEGELPLAVPPDINPLTDFVTAIRTGQSPAIRADEIMRATRFTLWARDAADIGVELTLDDDMRKSK